MSGGAQLTAQPPSATRADVAMLMAGRDLRCCRSFSLVAFCSAREFRLAQMRLISDPRAAPQPADPVNQSAIRMTAIATVPDARSRGIAPAAVAAFSLIFFFSFPAPLPPSSLFGRRSASPSGRCLRCSASTQPVAVSLFPFAGRRPAQPASQPPVRRRIPSAIAHSRCITSSGADSHAQPDATRDRR